MTRSPADVLAMKISGKGKAAPAAREWLKISLSPHPSPPSSDLTFPFATGRRPLQAQVANAQVLYLATLGSTLQPQPQRRRRRNQQRLIFAPRARTLLHICSRATEGKTSTAACWRNPAKVVVSCYAVF